MTLWLGSLRGDGLVSHNRDIGCQQVEVMGADVIMWRPWRDDPHLTADLETADPLAVYGERFRALAAAAREAEDMWARDIPMATLLWYRHYGWPVATSYVYMEGSYSLYWQRVYVGTLAPSSVYRASNIVGVTSQALWPEIRMTQPEGVCTQPHRLDTDVPLVIQRDDFGPWRLTVVGTQGMDTPVVVPSTADFVVAQLEPNLYTWDPDTLQARFTEQLRISQGLRRAAYDDIYLVIFKY
ncbi:hypothetical protein FRX31_033755 [Thalictrum thalictroides]|uniref:Uncharacterized protein n=1 Tax=Thalictrum thalictroides TaxID=46969 RepID=A0A7J6UVT6_THATH|nr:hypothetical protein FRX31_033755 [Thalictrum thalictroides]